MYVWGTPWVSTPFTSSSTMSLCAAGALIRMQPGQRFQGPLGHTAHSHPYLPCHTVLFQSKPTVSVINPQANEATTLQEFVELDRVLVAWRPLIFCNKPSLFPWHAIGMGLSRCHPAGARQRGALDEGPPGVMPRHLHPCCNQLHMIKPCGKSLTHEFDHHHQSRVSAHRLNHP